MLIQLKFERSNKHSLKMAENLDETFQQFMNSYSKKLFEIDQQYPEDEETKDDCQKYLKKLEVYKRFTDGLIHNGTHFLSIIDHLKTELHKTTDGASTTSNGSTIDNDQAFKDLEFICKCLSKRTELEEQAMNSVNDLQGIVEELMADKMKLLDENRKLRERAAKPSSDDDKRIAKSLKPGGDKLSDASSQTADAKPKKSSESVRREDKNCAGLHKKIQGLQFELSKKDKEIEMLEEMVRKMSSKVPLPSDRESNASDREPSASSKVPKRGKRSQSLDRDSPSTLTDCEKRDDDKFEDAFKELTAILKEKYQHLREYRAKNNELQKKLDECEARQQETSKLNKTIEMLKNENNTLNTELLATKEEVAALQELKKKTDQCNAQLESLKRCNQILARKFSEDETHVGALLDERHQLIKLNNELMASIAVCKIELAKYNTDKTA